VTSKKRTVRNRTEGLYLTCGTFKLFVTDAVAPTGAFRDGCSGIRRLSTPGAGGPDLTRSRA
jgi:hypothetical protein